MQLHTKIIIGLILGLLVGITSVFFGISNTITNWVIPFGTIFVKMLNFRSKFEISEKSLE